MKTVIDVPEDCSKCPCHVTAEAVIGQHKKNFYLCRAYSRILNIGVNGYGSVKAIERCEECEKAAEEIKKASSGLKARYKVGLPVKYTGQDESDFINCPLCDNPVARNDDYEGDRPKHCPECGTKLIYGGGGIV